MTTVTKPPIKPKLNHKDNECHRLVRLLLRAYYPIEFIAVVDTLLDLQVRLANKVTESDLAVETHLSPKLIREILHRLRQDQLVRGVQKSDANTTLPQGVQELTSRGKKKNYTRQPTVTFTWHIDFEVVVNVIKFRHWDIFEKLNKKVDRSEVFYVCPTPECDNHALSRKKSIMDLLLDRPEDGVFRCDHCFTHDPIANRKVATPLVLVAHRDSTANTNQSTATTNAGTAANNNTSASGTSSSTAAPASKPDLSVDPSESLKNKFNKQLGVLLEQLMKVDRILQEDMQNKKEELAAGVLGESGGDASMSAGGLIQFSSSSTSAGATTLSTTTAASSSSMLVPQSSVEDMISVDLTSADAPAAKKMKMEQVIASSTALPWDKAHPLSLAKVEEERRLAEAAKSAALAEEERRKQEEEQRRFQQQYEQQLAKQQAAAAAAAAAMEIDHVAASAAPDVNMDQPTAATGDHMDVDEVQVSVSGRMVPLSQITQEDIDQMTTEEFEHYSSFAMEEEL